MNIISFICGFLACFLACLILNAQAIKAARRRRKREREGKPKEKMQATKIIVFSILLTYHLAFIVGAWVVIFKDVYQLSVLLTFTGGVAVFAVAFYCWKSKAENLLKIKRSNPDLVGSLNDFSTMSSQ